MGLCFSSANTFKTLPHNAAGKMLWGAHPKNPEKSYTTVLSNHNIKGKILDSPDLKSFCFNELEEATNNFDPANLLGDGNFGYVFKGWIDKHSLKAALLETGMAIAVKALNQKGGQGQQEWLAEIKFLGQLYHPNLVKLIGYCLEDEQRVLVYEFMPNGSLDIHLFGWDFARTMDFDYTRSLSWNLRIKIPLDAAKGLAFLHDEPQNYNAKLCDFGLAKDGPMGGENHIVASIKGTHGYLAPEYADTGIFQLIQLS
ncbi:hypothetical protein JCGZ_06627 [Jatropha curcas]|uniref:non-specific serine/threonine protein kinase n=1 Tax=Jatropha curcas TaxID=180498 RepID=A0A067LCA4_JATCU|nr:hypothetical protein JCGZ_06627 [Jatropha curcas]